MKNKIFILLSLFILVLSMGVSAQVTQDDLLNGLVSYWKFDETSGTTAVDSHGSNDGGVTGAVWTTGKINNGLDFGTSSQNRYVSVTQNTALNDLHTDSFTVNAWIKPSGSGEGGSGRIMSKRSTTSSTGAGFLLFTRGTNGLGMEIIGGGSSIVARTFTDDSVISTSAWHMVSYVYDGSNIKIYVDGDEVTYSTQTSGSTTDSSSRDLFIGNNEANQRKYDGLIDEVLIVNRAYTSDEVSALYDIQKDGFESGSYDFQALAPPTINNVSTTNLTSTSVILNYLVYI